MYYHIITRDTQYLYLSQGTANRLVAELYNREVEFDILVGQNS